MSFFATIQWSLVVLLSVQLPSVLATGSGFSLEEDTTTTAIESLWFRAEGYTSFLARIGEQLASESQPSVHCLDCFGASESVRRCWIAAGFTSIAYDVKLEQHHDITTFAGCVELLRLMLMLLPAGIILAGPPCSLFVAACQSVHMRSEFRPLGNVLNKKVRLANRIWQNFARTGGIGLVWRFRRLDYGPGHLLGWHQDSMDLTRHLFTVVLTLASEGSGRCEWRKIAEDGQELQEVVSSTMPALGNLAIHGLTCNNELAHRVFWDEGRRLALVLFCRSPEIEALLKGKGAQSRLSMRYWWRKEHEKVK